MSRQSNTDGIFCFPNEGNKPITLNAFESIECAIAFHPRDWSEYRRDAWIYAIVFGWEDDGAAMPRRKLSRAFAFAHQSR